ncbi:MAG: hypothetical protein M3O36_01395, partial [Myxococcota bacterium]|nr:hypothetical protein [Myxococcota bacterium]
MMRGGLATAGCRRREVAALLGALVLHGVAFLGLSRPVPSPNGAATDVLGAVDVELETAQTPTRE